MVSVDQSRSLVLVAGTGREFHVKWERFMVPWNGSRFIESRFNRHCDLKLEQG
jgi:hypothetical protein